MNKLNKIIFYAIILSLSVPNVSKASEALQLGQKEQELKNQSTVQIEQPLTIADVSNIQQSTLVAPLVEYPNAQKQNKSINQVKTPKLDLRAVIFDPNADFSAEAKDENREMTKLEIAEENINEALHGEVSSMNDMSRKGLLAKKLTFKPEGGILDSLYVFTGFRGSLWGDYAGDDYKNTLYKIETLSTTFEGKFKDKKTSFRSMFFFQPSKEGHTFFNDFLGDQYIMHSLSKTDQVLAGYARNTYDIEGSMSPWVLPFMARTQNAKVYNNVRALQVKAQGNHKLYNYSAALGSSGRYFMDWFPGAEFVGSFAVKPLGLTDGRYGKLLAGGGLNAGNAEGRYTVGTAYLDYEYKRWNATVEYGSADGSNGSTGYTAKQSEGFNGTIAYRLTPKLQILARYDQFDPSKSKKNDIRREYTAGLNYFIKEQALRLILDYTVYSIETGLYGSRILLGTQILI